MGESITVFGWSSTRSGRSWAEEAGLNYLFAGWAELESGWLRTNLDFPWTEMLDFFSSSQTVSYLCRSSCFWETQTLSSVFSIRTLNESSRWNTESRGFLFWWSLFGVNAFLFLFVLCFTFLWMAILPSVRRAAGTWGAPYTLCIYLHFKIVLNELRRLPDPKSYPPGPLVSTGDGFLSCQLVWSAVLICEFIYNFRSCRISESKTLKWLCSWDVFRQLLLVLLAHPNPMEHVFKDALNCLNRCPRCFAPSANEWVQTDGFLKLVRLTNEFVTSLDVWNSWNTLKICAYTSAGVGKDNDDLSRTTRCSAAELADNLFSGDVSCYAPFKHSYVTSWCGGGGWEVVLFSPFLKNVGQTHQNEPSALKCSRNKLCFASRLV